MYGVFIIKVLHVHSRLNSRHHNNSSGTSSRNKQRKVQRCTQVPSRRLLLQRASSPTGSRLGNPFHRHVCGRLRLNSAFPQGEPSPCDVLADRNRFLCHTRHIHSSQYIHLCRNVLHMSPEESLGDKPSRSLGLKK